MFVEEFNEAVKAVVWEFVGAIDQWIRAGDVFGLGIRVGYASDIRIILPELGTGRAHIGKELTRITVVQIADRCREHDDVANGEIAFENKFSHA